MSSHTQRATVRSRHTDVASAGSRTPKGYRLDVIAATALTDTRVFSNDGEDIGRIRDVMLDAQSGRIAYAVMSTGGFLGIGDRLLAIPWSALTLDIEEKCFILSMPAESVKHAPGFDRHHWPSMADTTWATSVHQYYGREPYWAREPFARRDDLGVGDIPAGSSDAPEAGSVKL
ncbi:MULTISPECIES: PRC-barrel domain-containing protein [Paraburkholderia]|uniref:PRC-barrel domain-containing protein n=1 Tax=Paraburkholderia acidicola TaxID=1912599 RepID=A0ABV1LYN8_9BURK